VVIFVAVVAAAAFVGLSQSGALAAHHDIVGTFVLMNTENSASAIAVTSSDCRGGGGYSDIAPGTPVTVRDETGKLLASSSLGVGTGTVTRCTFTFTLKGVPEVSFYSVEVGRRGQISNSLADMQANGWRFGLTLGS
jgi:hypothetical protein